MMRISTLLAACCAAFWSSAFTTDALAQPPVQAPPAQAPPAQPPQHAPPAQAPYPYPPQPYPPYPPPYAYPPYAYPPAYPPPPPPQPAPPPPPQPPSVIEDWDPDAPVPKGYRMVDTVNGRVLGIGIAMLATGWFISALAGGAGSGAEADEDVDAADGVTAQDWTALYYPVVGPFMAVHTLDPSPSGAGLLIADGIIQLGGAVGIVVGFADRNYKLVRSDAGVAVAPMIRGSTRGLALYGRF